MIIIVLLLLPGKRTGKTKGRCDEGDGTQGRRKRRNCMRTIRTIDKEKASSIMEILLAFDVNVRTKKFENLNKKVRIWLPRWRLNC